MNRIREIREVGSIRDWSHIRFGQWWWIVFADDSVVGPMSNKRALRWLDDAPQRGYVKWSRKVPV